MMSALMLATWLAGAPAFTPRGLWEAWPTARFVPTASPCLLYAELLERLRALEARHRGALKLEQVGRSVEGRSIWMMTAGRGPKRVLLWSQMHGDEPSATPALLDLADFLLSRPEDPDARAILDETTLLMIPMLNPDGADRYERRNAQGIDVNRDALNLATPEGRALKAVRDRYEPLLGFNLHDQDRRTAVGDTGTLASIALLAVAGDAQGSVTPGRLRAKRICSLLVRALSEFVPGAIARYDEDWSPRAFGDNLTHWGTPVVLIESGSPPGGSFADLTRLNFVGLLAALRELARDDVAAHDPAPYEALPRNRDEAWADVIVRGGAILPPGSGEPFRADLAFNLRRHERAAAACASGLAAADRLARSSIVEIGDARFLAAGRTLDATGALVTAPFTAGVEGPGVRAWLDAPTLERLARLGVGTVVWYVRPEEREAADVFARSLDGERRARIETERVMLASRPALRLAGPPGEPAGHDLRATLAALVGPDGLAALERGRPALTLAAGLSSPRPTRFLPGRPASFVILRPPAAGPFSLEATTVESVWLEGQPVAVS